MDVNHKAIPKDGVAGLFENISSDATSGFLVFLLALPLSMGIAQASDFQPIYGLLSAMIGGLVVTFFAGSQLTVKGPAAGLIVIVAGAVSEFGGGEIGWRLTLMAIVAAGVVQIFFGVLKLGKLTDFFPLSAVHGMLAAIGIIIISKQLHVLLGQNPLNHEGKPMVEPIELISALPNSFSNPNWLAFAVGLVSLLLVFGWPMLKHPLAKRIPSPVAVLVVVIPFSFLLGLNQVLDESGNPKYYIHFAKGFFDILAINATTETFGHTAIFAKYVVMFALVGTLEALLTVKAIDMLDPYRRKANANKDLIALGIGNVVSGILGGLPMISEVARSSANVGYGGKTRWANFFHGVVMLFFLIFAVSFSDLIPKPALAAMLIGVGVKLAHPKEFKHMLEIGKEQLAIFLVTVAVTLATDLLLGILAGILLKIAIHLVNGMPLKSLFKTNVTISEYENRCLVELDKSAVFSNFIGFKSKIECIPPGMDVTLDLSKVKLIDHSFMENIAHIKHDYEEHGGHFDIVGLDEFAPLSKHALATRKKTNKREKK